MTAKIAVSIRLAVEPAADFDLVTRDVDCWWRKDHGLQDKRFLLQRAQWWDEQFAALKRVSTEDHEHQRRSPPHRAVHAGRL